MFKRWVELVVGMVGWRPTVAQKTQLVFQDTRIRRLWRRKSIEHRAVVVVVVVVIVVVVGDNYNVLNMFV